MVKNLATYGFYGAAKNSKNDIPSFEAFFTMYVKQKIKCIKAEYLFSYSILTISPVPNSKSNSVLSQNLFQVTFCTEFVWFRANSVIHSELSSDSEEIRIFPLNFALIQRISEITSQLIPKSFWISTKSWKFLETDLNQYWLTMKIWHGVKSNYLLAMN